MSNSSIEDFLDGDTYAVVGASRNRSKYGNKVFRAYQQMGRTVYPVNPFAETVEGQVAYSTLQEVSEPIHGVSIIVPPESADEVIRQAHELGIHHIWFQPGAESDSALESAKLLGMNVIANGPCLLVAVGYRE